MDISNVYSCVMMDITNACSHVVMDICNVCVTSAIQNNSYWSDVTVVVLRTLSVSFKYVGIRYSQHGGSDRMNR